MPFRDDLLNPIPGANPSGVDLRYDPITDKVKEARREEADLPQGDWKTTIKVADYAQVINLAGDALAKKGKDLQLAGWLVDAYVRKEGFAVLPAAFQFLHGLIDQFWDTLYPELEDDPDPEERYGRRVAPLQVLGEKLPEPLRALPITSSKLSWNQYTDSRKVGYEGEAVTNEKKTLRKALIEEGKLTPEEFDQAIAETPKDFFEKLQATIAESLSSLTPLTELCDEKFGKVSPSFVKSRTALEEISHLARGWINKKGGPSKAAAAAPPPEAPAAPAPTPVAAAPAAAAPAPAPAPAYTGAGGIEPTSIDDAAARLAAIARFLRAQDAYHIAPYLILRGFRWGEIRYNGPQIDAGMLEAPPPEIRKQLKQAAAESNWDRVLEITEAAMELPCGRGWLDLQRYTVQALHNKAGWSETVAGFVRTALRGLLEDLPGLIEMTLADDTPTANPETVAWIRQEVLTAPEGGVAAAPAPPPQAAWEPPPPPPVVIEEQPPAMEEEDEAKAQDPFDEALEAAQSGRLAEAVTVLSAELERARTGRGRFKRRMQIAHLCMAGGHEKIAYPILRDLAAEIDRRGLEDWEAGDVLAHPLALLLKCASSLNGDEEQMKTIYARICRLDPQKALQFLE